MPLEALRWPITPAGPPLPAHPLRHPARRYASWRLEVGGLVERRSACRSTTSRSRPIASTRSPSSAPATGVRGSHPAPVSQPWLHEAVGTAVWGGTPLAGLLEEAGLDEPDAVEVALLRPRPWDRGRRGAGLPAEPRPPRRAHARGAARLGDERRPARAAARFPAAAGRPGLVRHDEREVARLHRGRRGAVSRLPDDGRVPVPRRGGRRGGAGHAHPAARADGAAGHPGLLHTRAHRAARAGRARGPRVVGACPRGPASR